MRKLLMLSLGLVMIVTVTGCAAGVDESGAAVRVGYNDTYHHTV